MSTPNNPYAYPTACPDKFQFFQEGMTLRDYFAGQALAGLASKISKDREEAIANNGSHAAWEAAVSYALADAMLRERSKAAK